MATDWQLIRELMAAAISACEAAENLALGEADRDTPAGPPPTTVWDVMQGAWTYPENLRRQIIRARHLLGDDQPFVPESARVLEKVAQVCGELIGAQHLDAAIVPDASDPQTVRTIALQLARWYEEHMIPRLSAAARARRR